jgi:hypothetical protein
MTGRTYYPGDAVTLQATFTSIAGTNADPTTVALKVEDPGGTITTYTYADLDITKTAAGVFQYVLSLTLAGRYWYRWAGTGSVQAVSPDQPITVQPSRFN